MLYILKIFNEFKKFNFYCIYTSFRFFYKHRFLIRIIDNKSLGAFLCAAFKIKNGTNSVTSKVYTKKTWFSPVAIHYSAMTALVLRLFTK